MKSLFFLSCVGAAAVYGSSSDSSSSGSSSSSSSEETETISGYIYADNYFEFYFNGELIATDSIEFIPHNAEAVSFEAPINGKRTFAILARDFSDDLTSLEYDDNCIGDGGLRVMFNDGTISNGDWKCETIFYGPIDGGDCFGDCYGDDCGPNPARFIPPQCKYGQLGTAGTECRGEYYDYDENDWFKKNYNDNLWDYAIEFDDNTVGWGVSPSDDDIADGVIDPQSLDWTQYGESTFIWQPSLDFDNRILCRYSYNAGSSSSD